MKFQVNGFFKGLLVTAKLTLLDIKYLEHQHTCVEYLETTLNYDAAVITFYPNFNIALDDPQLNYFLKVQLQITSADQVLDTYQATLHYQMAYRVQNHAFELVLPITNNDLLITVDINQRVACTHISREPRKRTYKSYFFILELPIMKSYIKALSLYNSQNLSSQKN
ncbi:hypothetical protein NC653_011876 [Populus alba x Populus x berolinensis]|uniref:Uncharacterized protein n=1 Tax=Populus alba x Populus x berolinensis TaxID=444605 RepID=A0AAD6W6Z9_9ROSI|nr:hypothetical protein NC653_011876 [Populus alba x Populus x berolinensis]